MDSVSVAICGTWGKADKFAGLVNGYKGCKVTAVWDRDPEDAKVVAARLGCRAVTELDDIMNDPDIQGVMIITENDMHAEIALKACAAGKHIFVEKPVCTTLSDAVNVKDAVEKSKVKFFMTDPFVGPATICTKKILEEGRLGQPINCTIRMCDHPYPFKNDEELKLRTERAGGGMLSDRGFHLLHTIWYLFGKPLKIFARFGYSSEAARECGREEYVTMIMDYPDDFTVSLFCSSNGSNFNDGIEISCSRGCITDTETILHNGLLRWRADKEGNAQFGMPYVPKEPLEGWTFADEKDLSVVPDRHVIYWLRMILEDISAEEFGRDPSGCNGLNIYGSVELMEMRDAAIRSAAEGVPVMVG